jgi:hypothetical protein
MKKSEPAVKQTLQKILLAFLTLTFLSQNVLAREEGGESTGGGNAKSDLISKEEILEIARKSKLTIYFYLQGAEARFQSLTSAKARALHAPLFPPNRDPFQVLAKMEIDAIQEQPCYNEKREEKDASANAKTGRVCLSLDRLSKRISRSVGEQEVLALLVHEFSHLLGAFDEPPAEALQEDFRRRFQADQVLYPYVPSLEEKVTQAARRKKNLEYDLGTPLLRGTNRDPQGVWYELHKIVSDFSLESLRKYGFVRGPLFSAPRGYRDDVLAATMDTLALRLIHLQLSACALGKYSLPEDQRPFPAAEIKDTSGARCKYVLDYIFQNSKEISLPRFFAFAKGVGLLSATAEFRGRSSANLPVLKRYALEDSQEFANEIQRLTEDRSVPGSYLSVADYYEEALRSPYREFTVVVY